MRAGLLFDGLIKPSSKSLSYPTGAGKRHLTPPPIPLLMTVIIKNDISESPPLADGEAQDCYIAPLIHFQLAHVDSEA